MKAPDCNCSTEVIWRYIDRELSAREMARVSEQLRKCDNCQKLYEEQGRLARSLSSGFVDSPFGESFVVRSRERFSTAGLTRSREAGIRTIEGGTKLFFGYRGFSFLRSKKFMGIAAMLLLVPTILVIGYFVNSQGHQLLGGLRVRGQEEVSVRIVDAPGAVSLIQPSPRSSGFQAGRVYDVPPGTTLSLQLGAGDGRHERVATLDISGPARFATDSDCTVGNFHGNLIRGVLRARVEHRQKGESFRISAAGLHQARVIGTVFVLEAGDGFTRLNVEEGLVSFGTVGEEGEFLEYSKVGPADQAVTLSSDDAADRGSPFPLRPQTAPGTAVADSPAAVKPAPAGTEPGAGAPRPSTPAPSADSGTVPRALRDQLDRPANPRGD